MPRHSPHAGGTTVISAEGVSLTLGGRVILEDVNLAIASGENVCLIGPNGAGKTSLLRVLLGLRAPDSGRVWRRPGLRVGFVPQRLSLDPTLPLPVSRLLTLTRRFPAATLAAALAETGVEHLLNAPVQQLSGGELQRVLLARALLGAPQLLVLDEPVQGVDVRGEAALYRLIAGLGRRRGCSVLLVSHDLHLVMADADRVLCLDRRICCQGPPTDVISHPAYRRLFGRDGDVLAVYRHRRHAAEGEHG